MSLTVNLGSATPDFFRPQPRARRSDPATSHKAAESMRLHVGEQHSRILYALRHAGPRTCHELADLVRGLDHVQIARRLPELEQQGRIRKTAETRPSPTGRPCTVWEYLG